MKIFSGFKTIIPFFLGITMIAANANAQNDQSWVSATGDDANPCSRTAPCQTFRGALPKTKSGGEIVPLNPGSYGALNSVSSPISKSITIDGGETFAGILTTSNSGGIVVQAGPNDVVILRSLSISETFIVNVGDGIQFVSGKALIVENCKISGYQNAIHMKGGGHLVVRNTIIENNQSGILIDSTVNFAPVSLYNLAIRDNTGDALNASAGIVDICNSIITQNTGAAVLGQGTSTLNCVNNFLTANGTGIQATSGALIRISNNDIYDNGIGINNSGTIATANNNRIKGNGASVGAPTISIHTQ